MGGMQPVVNRRGPATPPGAVTDLDALPVNLAARIFAHPATGCWEWRSIINDAGYGEFKFRGKRDRTHRHVYRVVHGEIPAGLEIDHLCRNRACCNPLHIEAVTRRENNLRGESPSAKQARQTHCKHGHEFTEENTYRRGNKRTCRTCLTNWNRSEAKKAIEAARYQRKKEAGLL